MFLCQQAEFRDGTMSGAMDVDVKDENDEELDLEMNDEEADAKAAGATEAERITDVDAAAEEAVQNKLKQLFGNSDVFSKFIAPASPRKGGAKSKGRQGKGRKTEDEEDKELLEAGAGEGGMPLVDRLDKQPPSLVGTELRKYQLEGLNWMMHLYNNKISGILADEVRKLLPTLLLLVLLATALLLATPLRRPTLRLPCPMKSGVRGS